jgi:N-acetylmuramoyl-L-alanine amidase
MGSVAFDDGWIEVVTPCDVRAWVPATQLMADAPAAPLAPGTDANFADAVLVVDPGHGGPSNRGARSPDGALIEKEVNLDIAQRLRDLLSTPHDVDWQSGTIYVGDSIPAAGRVVVTRSGGGDDADYEAGLLFRAALADAVQAHALVSIHNNAGSDAESDVAASDVYYQSGVPESRRLAALLTTEFARSFAAFDADWVATLPVGAKSRLSPRDGETQYYGILRRSAVPAVIAEGAYIANQSEADLLATAEFRQAYADAVYRALVRFITTDDEGGVSYDPVVWQGNAGSGDARTECVLPEQPAP